MDRSPLVVVMTPATVRSPLVVIPLIEKIPLDPYTLTMPLVVI
jgi:hypothetical protein